LLLQLSLLFWFVIPEGDLLLPLSLLPFVAVVAFAVAVAFAVVVVVVFAFLACHPRRGSAVAVVVASAVVVAFASLICRVPEGAALLFNPHHSPQKRLQTPTLSQKSPSPQSNLFPKTPNLTRTPPNNARQITPL
jgi:hypothetical protein